MAPAIPPGGGPAPPATLNFTAATTSTRRRTSGPSSLTESNTIRIGNSLHSQTFIAGIDNNNIVGYAVTING